MNASLRQGRYNSKCKHEMFVFAAEVNHQYTMKKQSSKDVVKISTKEILDNPDIDTCRVNDTCRGNLSQTETDFFLNYLDKYFGLRMATDSECKKEGIPYLNRQVKRYYPGCTTLEPNICPTDFFVVTRK